MNGDDNFASIILRAFVLQRGGNLDASDAVLSGASGAIYQISDELTRELYGFVQGVASGLVMCGRAEGNELLELFNNGAADADVTRMRSVLKDVFDAFGE